MTLEKQQEQQFVQCFQLSMNDLKEMIKEAVKSVIPKEPINNTGLVNSSLEDELLSPKEVEKILRISSTTLWRLNKSGVLKLKSRVGRKTFYSKSDVYSFINNVA